MTFVNRGVQQIGEHGGLQSCGIRVDQHKERIIGQKPAGIHQEGINAVLDLPDLALGAASVGGRIHDDRVIGISPSYLALYKFAAVIDEPADRSVLEPRNGGVLPGPGDHTPGRVDMSDGRTGLRCCNCGTAGISEQVEDFNFSAGRHSVSNDLTEPVPVDGLLREEAGMLEVKGFEPEGQIFVVDRPLLGKVSELPLAAALIAAVIMRVGISPFSAARRIPDHLRVRTDQLVPAP